jgi:hypothetical protein
MFEGFFDEEDFSLSAFSPKEAAQASSNNSASTKKRVSKPTFYERRDKDNFVGLLNQ